MTSVNDERGGDRGTRTFSLKSLGYYLFVIALLGWMVSNLLDARLSDVQLYAVALVAIPYIFLPLALFSQKWWVLTASFLLSAASIRISRLRYLPIVIALASWLLMHLLNFVTHLSEWLVDLFCASWISLLVLALVAPFFRWWREFSVTILALLNTLFLFLGISATPEPIVLPNRWLQETGFRIYATRLIHSMPLDEFLSRCRLVDYVEEDGTKHQVGECDRDFRSSPWFENIVIYDPSGQSVWPPTERTLAWRLAIRRLPVGSYLVHDDVASHLVGNFFWVLTPNAKGDDGK
ncbi:MAG: hypothetical protein WA820_16305 [Bradyrhizobium sp.]|jgi:hypothetical protein